MAWSKSIAASAERYAQRCTWQHSSSQERNGYGENLYFSKNMDVQTIGARASNEWYEEVKDYNFASPGQALRYGAMIGHFTAMVWINTKAIGKHTQRPDNTASHKPDVYIVQCSMAHLLSCQQQLLYFKTASSGTGLACCAAVYRLCIRPLPLVGQCRVQ